MFFRYLREIAFLALLLSFIMTLNACSDSHDSGSANNNLGTPPSTVCLNQDIDSQFEPKKQYVMLTFDDGLDSESLKKILPLLKDCESDPHTGDVQNLASCMDEGTDTLKNADDSNVRITYFATVGQSGALDNMDYLASLGNEVANHTVTHGVKWGRQVALKDPSVFTESRWEQELFDNVELLGWWTSVNPDNIVGMRAPFLQLNNNTYPGLNRFLDIHAVSDRTYYDSNLTYSTGDYPLGIGDQTYCLYPPQLLTRSSYCSSEDPSSVKSGYTPLTDPLKCNEVIPDSNPHGIWEIPLPTLGNNAMELPAELADLEKFLEKQVSEFPTTGVYVPLLISIHSSEIGKHPDLGSWMQRMVQPASGPDGGFDVSFVTVSEVIRMYATGSDDVSPPESYPISSDCKTGIADGNILKCPSKYVFPETPCYTSGSCGSTGCSLICTEDSDYNQAEGCVMGLAVPATPVRTDPGAAGGFTTCNYNAATQKCEPNWESPAVSVYTSGAYPWIGNPSGNVEVNPDSSAADSCNFWPANCVSPSDPGAAGSPPPSCNPV